MMETDHDFKALAYAWVDGDPRSSELRHTDPDQRDRLAAKLAEALDRRRRKVSTEPFEGGNLIVRVPDDHIGKSNLSSSSLDQLEKLIQEHDQRPGQ